MGIQYNIKFYLNLVQLNYKGYKMLNKFRGTINSWKYNWFWFTWASCAVVGIMVAGITIIEYYLWRVL